MSKISYYHYGRVSLVTNMCEYICLKYSLIIFSLFYLLAHFFFNFCFAHSVMSLWKGSINLLFNLPVAEVSLDFWMFFAVLCV